MSDALKIVPNSVIFYYCVKYDASDVSVILMYVQVIPFEYGVNFL